MKLQIFALAMALSVTAAFSQVSTARLDGTVSDSAGAVVPGAVVDAVSLSQQTAFKAVADEKGYWAIPSLQSGTYKVTVSHSGFKTEVLTNVKMDAGVPATVNVTLQVGALTETIEVSGGAEVLQTDSSTIASTLQGTQIHDLPFTSHNATDLIATQPGTQTAQGPRYSVINGLPQSVINITLDGVNIQDNTNKSTDGVFNNVQARTEAIEEMTMSTAAANADSTGEGAAQVKFVTRSGSNTWHGGLFETNRNNFFEANYYFNSVNGLKRDYINLNEWGYRLGGPVKKSKLFFFTTFEFFFLPQSFLTSGQTWLTPQATNGIFTYKDGSGVVRTVNLYALASAAGFPGAPNPTLAKAYALIQQLTTGGGGTLSNRITTNNDYNRNNFAFPNKATNNRKFETTRLDYNLNEKHHLSGVWNYQVNSRNPDGLNGTLAILPGTGSVLGTPGLQGQYGINWTGSISMRSSLTSRLTNEATFGIQAGTNILGSGTSSTDYSLFGNVQPNNFGGYISTPYLGGYLSYAPRNAPVYQFNDSLSWLKGNHLLNFGGGFTQVKFWQAAANTSLIPQVSLATVAGDPVGTGSTNLFTTTNFPGASSTQLSDANNLYDILTGRVASITTSQVLSESTKTYGPNYTVDRDRMREFSLYVQDSWRLNPNLTINLGVRWDKQNPFENLDALYTSVGLSGLYGVSGVGHLFQPGTLDGTAPVFTPVAPGGDSYQSRFGNFNPTVGIAYKVPRSSGPLSWLTGKGDAVIRGGFSIATIREGMGFLAGVLNGNQGRSLSTSVDPVNFPSNFGPIGSVAFGGSYPVRAPTNIDPNFPSPLFPLPVQSGQTVSDYNPNIKPEYVQSWSFGFQRELDHDTVVDLRYVGTHGVGLWRSINLNEVNIVENGYGQQFAAAQNNLAIANGFPNIAALQNAAFTNPAYKLVTNYGNTGLPGQVAIPIIQTAIGSTTDTTTATYLLQGQAGASANAIATNATRMANLTKAGLAPVNYFQVNPLGGGSANEMTNGNMSTYNALQVEVRRRLSRGLQVQGSYAFAKSLTNDTNFTLRNIGGEKGPSPFDFRNAFKFTWIYQLPFGQGRPLLSGAHGVLGKVVEGWQISGVGRLQSGSAVQLTSGRDTFNQNDSGVVLHNIDASQLQSMMSIYKTSQVNASGVATGQVWYLPQSFITNTLAAFQLGTGTLNTSAPYIGPCVSSGQTCNRIFLYGPWISKWDVSLVKTTRIHERFTAEIRCQALNVFNFANFELTSATNGGGPLTIGSSFGQTTSAFRDLNNTNDPGSRTLEFVFRLNF
jgi:Carboxypeptidase regulatory-like domain/TonB dependent receptor